MVCRPLDEFKAFVKDEGFDLNEAEAQAVFDEMYEMDLSEEELDAVSGGAEWDSEKCVGGGSYGLKRK